MPNPHSHKLLLLTILLTTLLSCMKDKPEEAPSMLQWNPELAFPLGTDTFGMNAESGFDTSLYDPGPDGIPLWLEEDTLKMWGRMEFDLSSLNENTDDIIQILFRMNMENGFPHEMEVQAYFVDQNMQPLDSLFDEGSIRLPPASIGSQGEVLGTSVVRRDASFPSERIPNLESATELLLQGYIISPEVDTALVDYYPDFRVEADVGVMVELSIDYLTWQ